MSDPRLWRDARDGPLIVHTNDLLLVSANLDCSDPNGHVDVSASKLANTLVNKLKINHACEYFSKRFPINNSPNIYSIIKVINISMILISAVLTCMKGRYE